jgi:murein L,D-transpeptidase YcbB/YkuD
MITPRCINFLSKKLFPFLMVPFVFTIAACQSTADPASTTQMERDTTITQANAYSDLFLDSLQLENYVARSGWHDSLKKTIHNFYNSRNYEYSWLTQQGITEQAFAFENMLEEYINYSGDSAAFNSFVKQILDSATDNQSFMPDDSTRFGFEMNMSASFLRYARRAYQGNIALQEKDINWFIPRKRLNMVALLDSFTKSPNGLATEPVNQQYRKLKSFLLRYYQLEKKGGFPIIPIEKKGYRAGDSSAGISAIKIRLSSAGDYVQHDTSALFTNELKQAVMHFQQRYGLKEDGVAGGQTLRLMNEPVSKRIEQILVNMERMRWVPAQPTGDFILVNIPQYRLTVYEDGKPYFGMNIVVGTTQNKTIIFTGNLKHVVFSPYWNVPPGILRNEVLPAIKRNPSYLSRHHMERYNGGVRQKPGPWNALGKVKFLFPNQYNIYLHDTPSKNLFNEPKRSFSHGCIRVADPPQLAAWVLRNDRSWTQERIQNSMNAGKEQYVTVKDTIPVYIAYFTAWVDDAGILNFREDVYGHDKEMAAHLFTDR